MHQIAPMSEDQAAIKAAVEKTLEPFGDEYWAKTDETGDWPEEFCDAMAAGGWLGIAFPEEYGGAGLGLTEAALMMQTVTRTGAGFSAASAIHLNIFGPKPLERFGNPEQKRENLPKIISGQEKMCFAVTEPNSGLDTSSLETKAERTNTGYTINGRKIWTTGAQRADKILIIARTTPKDQCAKPYLGLSLFYTDLDPNKIERQPIPKMGRKAVECNMLYIDGLEVPKDHLIGEEGGGFKVAMRVLDRGRLHLSALCVGIAERLIADSVAFASERRQFGKPIAEFQLIQAMIADSKTEALAARALMLETARKLDAGKNITLEAAAAKLFASEMVGRVADRAVQIFGGAGYVADHGIERFYRDVRIFRIYEGTSQIQQLVIARETLKNGG